MRDLAAVDQVVVDAWQLLPLVGHGDSVDLQLEETRAGQIDNKGDVGANGVGEDEVGVLLLFLHGDEVGRHAHGLLTLQKHSDGVAIQVNDGVLVRGRHHAELAELGLSAQVARRQLGHGRGLHVFLAQDQELGSVVQGLTFCGWVVGVDLQAILAPPWGGDVEVGCVADNAVDDVGLQF